MKELVWELFFLQVEIITFMPFADFVKGKEPANFWECGCLSYSAKIVFPKNFVWMFTSFGSQWDKFHCRFYWFFSISIV